MREITDHRVNLVNDNPKLLRGELQILVTDEPGAGGANHRYEIVGFIAEENPSMAADDHAYVCTALFQNGPIADVGVNGITEAALLAIVADRLRSFQAGPYACRENALALTHLEDAMHWLHHRTRKRMARGVEGTSAR